MERERGEEEDEGEEEKGEGRKEGGRRRRGRGGGTSSHDITALMTGLTSHILYVTMETQTVQ